MINLNDYIKNVPNFPIEGIQFKDITPLLADKDAYDYACQKLADFVMEHNANMVLGPESRGFIFGCVAASKAHTGFVPIRKPGKLPREVVEESYDLEYGKNVLCIHADAIKKGDKVVIVDDLLATGGTIEAAIKLVKRLGGEVVGVCFLIELLALKGREKFKDIPCLSLLQY